MNYVISNIGEIYDDFHYPSEYIMLIEQGCTEFGPWYFLGEKRAAIRLKGLQTRYPKKRLVPFAKRDDNDDLSCFSAAEGEVIVIHDFAKDGFEYRRRYDSISEWIQAALNCIE